MELSFLTPLGALFVLAALVPVGVFRARERRVRDVRRALGLEDPARRSRLLLMGSLVVVCGLIALAAAQPVVATTRQLGERTDAQVFVVLDSSRSMLASPEPGAPSRFERAREIAHELIAQLPEIPVGVASLTDTLLPHLFPTTDRRVLSETLDKALSVESAITLSFHTTQATTLDALVAAPKLNYFPPAVKKRVLVVLTDGETRPLEEDLATAFGREPKIEVVFVHTWSADERIYETGVAEFGYKPDPESGETLERLASAIKGRALAESDSAKLAPDVLDQLGSGPTIERRHEGRRLALMPWITLLAFAPLAYVVRRRNM